MGVTGGCSCQRGSRRWWAGSRPWRTGQRGCRGGAGEPTCWSAAAPEPQGGRWPARGIDGPCSKKGSGSPALGDLAPRPCGGSQAAGRQPHWQEAGGQGLMSAAASSCLAPRVPAGSVLPPSRLGSCEMLSAVSPKPPAVSRLEALFTLAPGLTLREGVTRHTEAAGREEAGAPGPSDSGGSERRGEVRAAVGPPPPPAPPARLPAAPEPGAFHRAALQSPRVRALVCAGSREACRVPSVVGRTWTLPGFLRGGFSPHRGGVLTRTARQSQAPGAA